jgi:hypothetical protein
VPAFTAKRVSSPLSISVTVGVPVAGLEASSVTAPVFAPLIEAASLVLPMIVEIALLTLSAVL